MADICATAVVPAPRDEVFDFLADLENHWRISDRMVEVLTLDRSEGGPAHGGRVRLRGPLGVRRTAVTTVVLAERPAFMRGSAELGRRTLANVEWRLEESASGTAVSLTASVQSASALDRLLLLLGGRSWLERRFRATLDHLVERFRAGSPGPLAPADGAPAGRSA